MSKNSILAKSNSRGMPENEVCIAAVQMTAGPEVSANLKEAARLIDIAVTKGAKLVVLPEYFCIMGMKDADKVVVREEEGSGPIQEFLGKTAKSHGIWLIGGSVPLVSARPDKVRNSCLVYDDSGKQVARYDKIHLFNFEHGEEHYAEEKTIEAGNKVVTLESPFGRIGLSICYDLRFPELYRSMGQVDIILAPSAFTATTGKAHWETLIRARAIENLAYMIAPAQSGRHINGHKTYGDSMIVDPWGVILDHLPKGPGVVLANISQSHQKNLRNSLPALKHRTLHFC
jgi:predicted amidohydrolase